MAITLPKYAIHSTGMSCYCAKATAQEVEDFFIVQLLTAWRVPTTTAFRKPSHPTTSIILRSDAKSAIRLGYYSALGDADTHYPEDSTDPDPVLDALNTHVDPNHVRHCFDYLRQTLITSRRTLTSRCNGLSRSELAIF